MTAPTAWARFALPDGSEATEPAEHRGLARDGVRLLVAEPDRLRHVVFRDLPAVLRPGDLVVLNTSATLPAAVHGTVGGGRPVPVHVAAELDDGSWVVEVRLGGGRGPDLSRRPGDVIVLPGGVELTLTAAYPDPERAPSRLWRARARSDQDPAEAPGKDQGQDRRAYLVRYGEPIRYSYLKWPLPLEQFQTVYAGAAGSAELVSAGRPFTDRLLTRLIGAGVMVAPLTLHTGVSSPDKHEPPAPEPYLVPPDTARLVNSAKGAGRRVVAVGTTVVRALETVATPTGEVVAGQGWTDLVLDADRPARCVDGLITGLHEPQASHLFLLESVAGPALVSAAYAAAVEQRYLWHEFGDSMLFLP